VASPPPPAPPTAHSNTYSETYQMWHRGSTAVASDEDASAARFPRSALALVQPSDHDDAARESPPKGRSAGKELRGGAPGNATPGVSTRLQALVNEHRAVVALPAPPTAHNNTHCETYQMWIHSQATSAATRKSPLACERDS
jgi:hypothetical protein